MRALRSLILIILAACCAAEGQVVSLCPALADCAEEIRTAYAGQQAGGDLSGSYPDPVLRSGAVAVPTIADGTPGEVLTWGSGGAPATVAGGSDGEVLTSRGPGRPPVFAPPPASANAFQTWTVDCQGGGDYTSIKAAADAVQALPIEMDNQFGVIPVMRRILVRPCAYFEEPFRTPDFTELASDSVSYGASGQANQPEIYFTSTSSGDLITLGRSSGIAHLSIWFYGFDAPPLFANSMSGDVTVVRVEGASGGNTSYTYLDNVSLRAQVDGVGGGELRLVECTACDNNTYGYLNEAYLAVTASPVHGPAIRLIDWGGTGPWLWVWNSWLNGNGASPASALTVRGTAEASLYDVKLTELDGQLGGFATDLEAFDTGRIWVQATPFAATPDHPRVMRYDRSGGLQRLTITDSGDGFVATASEASCLRVLEVDCQDVDGCALTLGSAQAMPGQLLNIVNSSGNPLSLPGVTNATTDAADRTLVFAAGGWRQI